VYCVVFDASKERAAACDEALQAIDDCHVSLTSRSNRGIQSVLICFSKRDFFFENCFFFSFTIKDKTKVGRIRVFVVATHGDALPREELVSIVTGAQV